MVAWQFDGAFDDAVCGGRGAVVFHADGTSLVFFYQYTSADAGELIEECFGHC